MGSLIKKLINRSLDPDDVFHIFMNGDQKIFMDGSEALFN